jgi:hypothetical protein
MAKSRFAGLEKTKPIQSQTKHALSAVKWANFMSLTIMTVGGIISVRIFGKIPNNCCKGCFQGERR